MRERKPDRAAQGAPERTAERTVILAAGEFPPRGSEPERLLLAATRTVACDSAALAYRRRFRRDPDAVVGDMDSLPDGAMGTSRPTEFRRIPDQETNDLDKAIAFCRTKGWTENLVIVGATGKRTDHAIGNVYRALAAEVPVVEAEGEFLPVRGKLTFRTWKGAGVSVFAPDSATRMTSRGLKWKLDGVRFANPYCATLNRASSETVTVTATRPAFVYVQRNPSAVCAAVSLGSNVGRRASYLRRALAALAKLPGTRLLAASAVRETEPVGVPPEFAAQKFLNQAALFETTLSPIAFSRAMHAVEDRLGRVRTVRNGPRTIDLDLILFGDVRMDTPELTLPHPRARERAFVREPLAELGIRLPRGAGKERSPEEGRR